MNGIAADQNNTNADVLTDSGDGPLYVHLVITDPDVLAAVTEHPSGHDRDQFLGTCLKVGVLALRAAKGAIDGASIRSAGDQLITQLAERLNGHKTLVEETVARTLAHYLDPGTGVFQSRLEDLVNDDGQLPRLLRATFDQMNNGLGVTLERFLGEHSEFLALLSPSENNRLLQALKSTVDEVAQQEKNQILAQFSLDNPQSALTRLIRELTGSHSSLVEALTGRINEVAHEFSLDKPDSALNRLLSQVDEQQKTISAQFSLDSEDSALSRLRRSVHEQIGAIADSQQRFHGQVLELVTAFNTKRTTEARSTGHGAVFEEAVGEQLRAFTHPAGDVLDACGTTTGLIRNSKIGDFVITLSPDSVAADARIAVEAKESASYTLKATLTEADEARRNRGADCCLFVHSAKTAPSGLDPLARYGRDIVVVWNPEDPATDLVLRAGYLTAKALSVRAAQHSRSDAANYQAIDKAIEALRKQVSGFDELRTTGETIQNGAVKILDRVRIMRTDIERQLQILAEHTAAFKTAADDEGCLQTQ